MIAAESFTSWGVKVMHFHEGIWIAVPG